MLISASAPGPPDSNAAVPFYGDRFGGDFMLNSQGDQQQIFYSSPWQPLQVLSAVRLC